VKFPDFRHHDVYITGESYAGIYVPTLTKRILDGQKEFQINLKVHISILHPIYWFIMQGIAIGNGLVDRRMDEDTTYRFSYGHGIIDDARWNSLTRSCCNETTLELCDLSHPHDSRDCASELAKAYYAIQTSGY